MESSNEKQMKNSAENCLKNNTRYYSTFKEKVKERGVVTQSSEVFTKNKIKNALKMNEKLLETFFSRKLKIYSTCVHLTV